MDKNHLRPNIKTTFCIFSLHISKSIKMPSKNIFLLLLLSVCLMPAYCQSSKQEKILKTFHSISSHELLDFATEISSEKYNGRLSGSPGYINVANWCANKFQEWGIDPANNGSYFQYFPNPYTEVYSSGNLSYTSATGEITSYCFPDDYFPGSNSASGTVTGEMVYIGYGISAPELQYDDYKNIDVAGKIVILEPGIPYTKNDTTLRKWTPYAYHRYKFRNAVKHGARGLLYMSKIANPNTVHLGNFIYAHINEEIALRLFSDAGKEYNNIKNELKAQKTPSFALNPKQKITITAQTKHFPDTKANNVVGLIEGSDPELKNEVIIVGGHLDGQGNLGVIFPGALDNASGVADILGAAKALASSEIKPKRSILFILFGGEECGLYGSKYYTQHPLFPANKTVFMINLDMVGNGTGFYLGSAKSYPKIFTHFENVNNNYLHRKMGTSEWKKYYGRPRSDATHFENLGIKTISFYTSESVKPVYYHHPLDNIDALTPEIMEDAAKLLFLGILKIANDTLIQ